MIKKLCDESLVGGKVGDFLVVLAILTIFIAIKFFKDSLNSCGGYFLVRGSDKKCGEYKNWVKILRSDSYRGAILARKKW